MWLNFMHTLLLLYPRIDSLISYIRSVIRIIKGIKRVRGIHSLYHRPYDVVTAHHIANVNISDHEALEF